ncbi:MAG: hypothetical protein WKF96_01685 [Solirubrobacteraceae bacterium]
MATARVGTRLTSPESLKSSINAGPFRVLHAHQLRNPGLSPRMTYRYVASIYNGERHWLEFDDDLGQLVLTLAQGVVGEEPWSPEEVLDLDTGQRLPVGISTSVWLPKERTVLVQSVCADLFVNRQ